MRSGILLIVTVLITACSSAPPLSPPRAATHVGISTAQPGHSISEQALAMIGVRYRYGGNDPATGFDCSGLVYYAYSRSGLSVPRTSQSQFRAARKIGLSDVEPGDVLFFQDQEKLSHVGIYVGDGRFVHAPASGRSVTLARIDTPYYQRHLVAVGRLIPD
jgi:cell wall-associated NlpC family hydrolase